MRRLPIVVVLVGLVSSLPLAARATVVPECSFDAGTATVNVTIQGGSATLARSGDAITVDGLDCGGTVTTTDAIAVTAAPGDAFTLSLAGGPFAPGLTDEGDGSSEIEITVDETTLGALSSFTLIGSAAGDTILAGSGPYPVPVAGTRTNDQAATFDLNGDEAVPDTDLQIPYWVLGSNAKILLGGGNDRFDGSGYLGSAPIPLLAQLSLLRGGAGDDWLAPGGNPSSVGSTTEVVIGDAGIDTLSFASQPTSCDIGLQVPTRTGQSSVCGNTFSLGVFERIVGHDGRDIVQGGPGNERIDTLAGDDTVIGTRGDDVLNAGSGRDRIAYDSLAGPVTVDLRRHAETGPQGADALHGFEMIDGTPAGDVVRGNAAANEIAGLGGNDVLVGRGGIDSLLGGDGFDRCRPGSPGTGEVADCEVVR